MCVTIEIHPCLKVVSKGKEFTATHRYQHSSHEHNVFDRDVKQTTTNQPTKLSFKYFQHYNNAAWLMGKYKRKSLLIYQFVDIDCLCKCFFLFLKNTSLHVWSCRTILLVCSNSFCYKSSWQTMSNQYNLSPHCTLVTISDFLLVAVQQINQKLLNLNHSEIEFFLFVFCFFWRNQI